MQVDQDLWMRARKFEESRRYPECAQSFCACNPDFAPQRLRKHTASTDKSQRRFLHLLGAGQEVMTGPGQADAVAVSRKQHRADLAFQLFDPSRNAVTGHAQPARCGAKAARPRHLKEDPNAFPVWTSVARYALVLKFVSTDCRIGSHHHTPSEAR